MSDNNRNSKLSGLKNLVYSVLVFTALSMIGIAVSGPTSEDGELGRGSIIAIGLSIVITIVFSMWFSKRNKA